MEQRRLAAQGYVDGRIQSLAEMLTHGSPATFFGPAGGRVDGPKEVLAEYERGSKEFEPGGSSELRIVHMSVDEHLAYWVGFQRATVNLRDREAPVQMDLRITELFRREKQAWKLFHRHADMLTERKEG